MGFFIHALTADSRQPVQRAAIRTCFGNVPDCIFR